jgi:hypothetical protein
MFIDSIKKVYKGSEEESGGAGSAILILIILIIIFYFYLKVSQTQVLIDWKNQKCNPRYIFFSYYMNPVEGQSPYKSTMKNFMQCMRPFVSISKSKTYKDLRNTTKNISQNTDDLSRYVNIINNDMNDKIKGWRDQYNTLDQKEKKITNEADERYYKEKDMYEKIRIYAQRIHDVIYSITFFIKNKLLFQVSENKKNFKIKNYKNKNINIVSDDVNFVRRELYNAYMSISNNSYKQSFDLLNYKRNQPNFDPKRTDFSECINRGNDAIKEYQMLIDIIDEFNRQNHPSKNSKQSLLNDTNTKCSQLEKFGVSCQEIYPNWPKRGLP